MRSWRRRDGGDPRVDPGGGVSIVEAIRMGASTAGDTGRATDAGATSAAAARAAGRTLAE